MQNENSKSSPGIFRGTMEANDEEWVVAGRLLNTEWIHEDYGEDCIDRVTVGDEREQGHTFTFPRVHIFGRTYTVEQFVGDVKTEPIEPSGWTATSLIDEGVM